MKGTSVLIADDHPIFRRGLRALLEPHPRFRVVAEVADGLEALEALREERPDIGVLDLSMPQLDGLEVLEQTRGWPDPPDLVLLTLYEDYVERALSAGARGYLLKDNTEDELVACLDAVARGARFVSAGLVWSQAGAGETLRGPLTALTPSERRVLRLLAGFKTSREIAAVLCVSSRTVQNHRANMCRKLGLRGPKALLQFALEHADDVG